MNADELKTIRAKLGASASRVARFLGVATRTLQSWEAGDHPVPGPVARLMSLLASGEVSLPASEEGAR
jgi:DNA-binding transcriptional regulator YiaG